MESVNISELTWQVCPICGSDFKAKSGGICRKCARKAEESPKDAPRKKKEYPKKAFLVYKCPKCGEPVVLKDQEDTSPFYGCSNYPDCDFTSSVESIDAKAVKMYYSKNLRHTCPLCGDEVITMKRKEENHEFLGCRNPECKFAFSLQDKQFIRKHVIEE